MTERPRKLNRRWGSKMGLGSKLEIKSPPKRRDLKHNQILLENPEKWALEPTCVRNREPSKSDHQLQAHIPRLDKDGLPMLNVPSRKQK